MKTMVYTFLRNLSLIILKIFFGLKVRGKENFPKRGGFILAGNHVSLLDPLVLSAASPRELNFMARHDLFSNRFFSWLISSANAFPVQRESADFSALREAIRRIQKGGGLLLFPEGRRREEKDLHLKPQEGVGFLASKLNVPVIPAFVKGTGKAMPKGEKCIRRAKISVNFGKPVYVEKGADYSDIAHIVMENIKQLGKNS